MGIKTWVSCEPVLNPESIYMLIRFANYIDKFKIGKLNYFPSDIDWKEFGYPGRAASASYTTATITSKKTLERKWKKC